MTGLPLRDSFGRPFHYLRLSVHDACNFRCVYCLPEGARAEPGPPPLSLAEIARLVRGFAGLGFWKVRLTGGEPTVRPDIVGICRAAAAAPGVRKVAVSTNGWRLRELARGFREAGVAAVNASVDSLDRARFARLSGADRLPEVLAGVEAAMREGLEVKLNAVLMRDENDGEIGDFLELARREPLTVRFIELMPTAGNRELFERRRLPADAVLARLEAEGWTERPRREGDGPARVFGRPGARGGVGVIAPYSPDFCSTCNRLRVTSRGGLRLCLFAEGEASLRPLLQEDSQLGALQDEVRALLSRKEPSHYLPQGRTGDVRHFAAIGG